MKTFTHVCNHHHHDQLTKSSKPELIVTIRKIGKNKSSQRFKTHLDAATKLKKIFSKTQQNICINALKAKVASMFYISPNDFLKTTRKKLCLN
jgi:alcohol dehydrogenase class IV